MASLKLRPTFEIPLAWGAEEAMDRIRRGLRDPPLAGRPCRVARPRRGVSYPGRATAALVSLPIGVGVIVAIHTASLIGQRLSADQIRELTSLLEIALERAQHAGDHQEHGGSPRVTDWASWLREGSRPACG